MCKPQKYSIIIGVCIFFLAFSMRYFAANRLKIDYDEPIYINAALEYTKSIRSEQFTQIAWITTNIEHPALYKLVYGVAYLGQPPIEKLYEKDLEDGNSLDKSAGKAWVMIGRYISAVLASLTAGLLGIINPIAGIVFSINTLCVKYTSQVYLEALPIFSSFLAAITYLNYYNNAKEGQKNRNATHLWLVLSAAFLGATAASKYLYCIVGLAIVVHQTLAVIQKKIHWKHIFILIFWGLASFVLFILFNPMLWPHPIGRLVESVTFHLNYPATTDVTAYSYPFFQPIRWLSFPFSFFNPKPETAFIFQLDWLIFGLAIIGLPRLYLKKKLYFFWLILGLMTLLVWGTKWPQYILIIMVPYGMSANQGVIALFAFVKKGFIMLRKPDSRNI